MEKLITAMRTESCPWPFEILVVNNNSQDHTLAVLQRMSEQSGAPLRFVTETVQGIVAARNRAIEEAMASAILIFIDDDKMPRPGVCWPPPVMQYWNKAHSVRRPRGNGFSTHPRPSWLGDELLGFLAATDHGSEPFWIKDTSTPIWTANIAYDMRLFRDDPGLRFDKRYDRKGNEVKMRPCLERY